MTPTSLDIFEAARVMGTEPFIVTRDRTLSFGEVAARVTSAMRWMKGEGVVPFAQSPVAFVARNDLTTVSAMLALMQLRVPAMLLNPRWSPGEFERVLTSGGNQKRAALLELPTTTWPPSSALPEPSSAGTEDRIVAVIHTSGSEAHPRGVLLSLRAFRSALLASASNLGWHARDRWVLSLSLSHVGGLSILMRCLAGRKPLVLASHEGLPCDAAELLEVIRTTRATLASLVPTQLYRLLELSEPCPSSLRAILLGGAASSPSLLERALRAGWPVLATYGSTETCSQIATQSPDTPLSDRSRTGVGRPLPGVEVRIRDGRIAVRSDALASGYYPPSEPLTDDAGWFLTNDHGAFDDEGNLHVHGRADDVIVTGGENVFPGEVEAILLEHPEIREACVFGLVDAEYGQEVAAVLVTATGSVPGDLAFHVSQRLTTFKRPRRIALAHRVPVASSGKVSRRQIAAEYGQRCQRFSYR